MFYFWGPESFFLDVRGFRRDPKAKGGQECPPHARRRGRHAPPPETCDLVFYVPSFQLAKYSSCSGVNRSILMPIDSSFSLATRLSSSAGTV